MLQPNDSNMEQLLSFDALLNQFKAVLGPSSANNSISATTTQPIDSDGQLFEQINQLREWRELQQQKLMDNQLTQQQLLNLEKEKLYGLLGLSMTSEPLDSDEAEIAENYRIEDCSASEDSETEAVYQVNEHEMSEESDDDDDAETPRTEIEMPLSKKQQPMSPPLPKPKPPAAVDEYKQNSVSNDIPKRPFLKRGEGLTTRFKVSPDTYRLDNLPRYKYANRVAQALSSKRRPTTTKQQRAGAAEGRRQLGNNSSSYATNTHTNENQDIYNINTNECGSGGGDGGSSSNTNNNNNNSDNNNIIGSGHSSSSSSIRTDKTSRKRIDNNNTNRLSGKSVRCGRQVPLKLKLIPKSLANDNSTTNVKRNEHADTWASTNEGKAKINICTSMRTNIDICYITYIYIWRNVVCERKKNKLRIYVLICVT